MVFLVDNSPPSMSLSKPTVVVFFGGASDTHDLSQETGYWFSSYVPRSKYRVVPVRVTPDGQWQVPLGALPQQGPVNRMMEMLFQSVRAVTPRQGLERLLRHPVAALMTTVRGQGGDDGGLQRLGDALGIPVVGSNSNTCYQTSQKHLCAQQLDDIVASPYSLHFRANASDEKIVDDVDAFLDFPVFVKPATAEGSSGVHLIESLDNLLPAIQAIKNQGDILVQEKSPGSEMTVTVIEDAQGHRTILPPTLIDHRQAPFYDGLAKRRAGRVQLHTTTDHNRLLTEVQTVASDIFDELQCKGYASFDLTADANRGISLLEANTVPMFTAVTALPQQLEAAHLHPATMVDSLIARALR